MIDGGAHGPVLTDRHGATTVITINRSDRMNALDKVARFAMADAIDDFLADPAQRVAIVTATGQRAFSVGLDLAELAGLQEPLPPMPASGFGGLTARLERNKPVIAAVNGAAAGGGFELALACDIAICTPNAWFALPEPDVGLVAIAGGLVRLARAVGERRGAEIALTRRRVGADEALAIGLVSAVVPQDALRDTALALAATIARASPLAIAATRALIRDSVGLDLVTALELQARHPLLEALLASGDPGEGVKAFVEKRSPRWAPLA